MVLLDATNVVHYLFGRGLITRESVVNGDLVVVDASRRNRNFKIQRTHAPSLFVKQIRVERPEAIATLRCEAWCYRLVQSDPVFSALAPLVPDFWHYDARSHVLVVEWVTRSENLRLHLQRLGRISSEVAEQLGTAIGQYHAGVAVPSSTAPQTDIFPRRTPWILSFHTHQHLSGPDTSGAVIQLHSILQQYPEFARRIDELRSAWQTNCLIHGDLKWDNCLVYPRDAQESQLRFKIVDWELADIGDACWDLGAILQAFLSSWIFSMPDTGLVPATLLVERAQYQLDDMQPVIAAFWLGYTAGRQIDDLSARALLERSMRYGAARMVQTAFELSVHRQQLTSSAVRLLQLSNNILASPLDAVEHLLEA